MDTIDTTVLGGRVKVKQPASGGLRVTMDTIFVAAACPASAGDRIGDFGAGTGAAGLCVAARVDNIRVTFVEVQVDFAKLAHDNAALNNVPADSLCADIRGLTSLALDHIVCNPPYLEQGAHFVSPDPPRQKALGGIKGDATLDDWVAAAARCLGNKGSLSMIHRADALDDVLYAFKTHEFGAIEIWPLQPYSEKDASRIVVRGYRRRKTKLKLHAPIILHTRTGAKYSQAAMAILEEAWGIGD